MQVNGPSNNNTDPSLFSLQGVASLPGSVYSYFFGSQPSAPIPTVQVEPPQAPPPPPPHVDLSKIVIKRKPTSKQELISFLEDFKIPFNDLSYLHSLIELRGDREKFEIQMRTVPYLKKLKKLSDEEIESTQNDIIVLQSWIEKLEQNSTLVDFTKLTIPQLEVLINGTKDADLLNTIALVLKEKVLDKPMQDFEDYIDFIQKSYFISDLTMDHLKKHGKVTQDELPKLMSHLPAYALFNPLTNPTFEDVAEYRHLVHQVLKNSSKHYKYYLMNGFINGTALSLSMVASRLAWAIHDDPDLTQQLCLHKNHRGFIPLLKFEIENVKRRLALESVIKDIPLLQNEYFYHGNLQTNPTILKQVNATNAKTVMEGMHWISLLTSPDAFTEHGLNPLEEVYRQLKFENTFDYNKHSKNLNPEQKEALFSWLKENPHRGVSLNWWS